MPMAMTDTNVEVSDHELSEIYPSKEEGNEDKLASLQNELVTLNSKLDNSQSLCEDLRMENEELKKSRAALSLEIMDLTKALFEEANGMVAEEAKARAHLEQKRIKLEGELEATKEHLRLEKQQLFELRERLLRERLESRERAGTSSFQKHQMLNLLADEPYGHRYFPVLFPTIRSDSRRKCLGDSSSFWDELSRKFETDELREFSKFVERISEHDAEGVLRTPFVKKICEEDVGPCLNFSFKPRPFIKKIILSLLRNLCSIEKTPPQEKTAASSSCSPNTLAKGTISPSIISSDESALSVDLEMTDVDYRSMKINCEQLSSTTIHNNAHSNNIEVITTQAGDRLRGIMSHFTTSVSSLPDALLPGSSETFSNREQKSDIPKYCSLCGRPNGPFKYRFRISDEDPWNYIDRACRSRLVAAGHFFTFLRHLRAGLHTNRPILDLYYDTLQYRRLMFYARLHPAATSFFLQSDFEAFLDVLDNCLNDDEKDEGNGLLSVVVDESLDKVKSKSLTVKDNTTITNDDGEEEEEKRQLCIDDDDDKD